MMKTEELISATLAGLELGPVIRVPALEDARL
jgi:hypothetical protein